MVTSIDLHEPETDPQLESYRSAADGSVVPDAQFSLTREAGHVHVLLPGTFDERGAEQLGEFIDWLLGLGPLHLVAEVVDDPAAPDGFAFQRLAALARARATIEAGGGSLQVSAAPRLDRTLAAMRLARAY